MQVAALADTNQAVQPFITDPVPGVAIAILYVLAPGLVGMNAGAFLLQAEDGGAELPLGFGQQDGAIALQPGVAQVTDCQAEIRDLRCFRPLLLLIALDPLKQHDFDVVG